MALKPKSGTTKGSTKRSNRPTPSSSSSTTKPRKPKSSSTGPKPKPTQQKTKSKTPTKKKAPHLRYTEKELKIPHLNGIKPMGVQKPPRSKKGKTFVDDREGMNTILALVMAEKEGNIESKMMRSRQLEEVREARRVEAEKRAEGKREGLEGRKRGIKDASKRGKGRKVDEEVEGKGDGGEGAARKGKKRVSFG